MEAPVAFPVLVEKLWWHPRSTADPAHVWLRERIAQVAARAAA
jgi:hypothetical protein